MNKIYSFLRYQYTRKSGTKALINGRKFKVIKTNIKVWFESKEYIIWNEKINANGKIYFFEKKYSKNKNEIVKISRVSHDEYLLKIPLREYEKIEYINNDKGNLLNGKSYSIIWIRNKNTNIEYVINKENIDKKEYNEDLIKKAVFTMVYEIMDFGEIIPNKMYNNNYIAINGTKPFDKIFSNIIYSKYDYRKPKIYEKVSRYTLLGTIYINPFNKKEKLYYKYWNNKYKKAKKEYLKLLKQRKKMMEKDYEINGLKIDFGDKDKVSLYELKKIIVMEGRN
ncbi:hypothetical protein [Marinitoga aeolica]|uniref:Uncharacterized protein n=1 Tax=Marinitoga aeolica TaxID=2809031 RepID=A0ABY8PRF5_9BACT|nr:hypothetical protein [Marinitoga aeolica]WGS65203.1 hypothetical protein JRV97_01200 [Marinitoga aeolica]